MQYGVSPLHSVMPAQVQPPPVQPSDVSGLQVRPHEPQWLGVTSVLMHDPVQQLSDAPHARPHAPQLSTSRFVSRHSPPQHLWPVGHAAPSPHLHTPPTQDSPTLQAGVHGVSVVHVPETHAWPEGQTTPQPPQLFVSVAVLMHAPPQQPRPSSQGAPPPHLQSPSTHVSPVAQAGEQAGIMQTPDTHSSPASVSQATPQAPQCSLEVASVAHVPPQHVSPAPHAPTDPHRHVPDTHVSPEGEHTVPHVPQFDGSLPVLAQMPSQHSVVPPQPMPAPHASKQRPYRHVCPAAQAGVHPDPASLLVAESRPASTAADASDELRPPSAHPASASRTTAQMPPKCKSFLIPARKPTGCARIVHGRNDRSTHVPV